MTVYVDTMRAPYRGMRMSHMVADSTAELLAMADRIGVARRWLQCAGTYREHFDVCESMRAAALRAGAVEISERELGAMLVRRRRGEFTTTAERLRLSDLPAPAGEFTTGSIEDFKRRRGMGGTATALRGGAGC